jgi:beta-lactamase superfamily II metal-dependent hydrolase
MNNVVRSSKWLCIILVLTVLAPWSAFLNPTTASASTGSLKVHMLSHVDGRNDSFIFELPNGEVMVLDNYDSSLLISKLGSLGITEVQYVVGTHRHVDHIGGLDNFINSGFTIDNTKIYYPDGDINKLYENYTNLVSAATSKSLSVEYLLDGEYILNTTYNGKPLVIMALGPLYWRVNGYNQDTNDFTVANDASLVLKITYGNKSILMMGDAKSTVESDLISYRNSWLDDIQVLKVGHHGIKDEGEWSASDAFLDRLGVNKALISNGTHDIAVNIVNNLQERNIKYWSTGQNGVKGPDVMISTDGTADWTSASTPYWQSGNTGTAYYFIEHVGDSADTNGLRRLWNNPANGTDVSIFDAGKGYYEMRWQLIDAGGGYSYIQNMANGMRLYGKSDDDVYMVAGSNTSDNVKWKLTNYDTTWKYIDNKAIADRKRLHAKVEESWLVRLSSTSYTGYNLQWKLVPVPLGS